MKAVFRGSGSMHTVYSSVTWLHRILTSYILLLFAVKSITYVVSLRCAGYYFYKELSHTKMNLYVTG